MTTSAYSDTGLTAATTYFYKVIAVDQADQPSMASTATSATTLATAPATPAAPSNIALSSPASRRVRVTWQDNSTNETGFRLERRLGTNGAWQLITNTGANAVSFDDTTVKKNQTYYYRVRSFNAAGFSAWVTSGSVRATSASLAGASVFSTTQIASGGSPVDGIADLSGEVVLLA